MDAVNDLISRQEAIESVNELRKSPWYNKVPNIFRNEAVDIVEKFCIKDLPSAQQWIPCSERLPEKNGRYLVTNDGWGEWIVDWNAWLNGQWLYNSEPVAWMPLPEPYKGETA